jgi:outer membrane protein assembly factor BamD (BamD/ComL family)
VVFIDSLKARRETAANELAGLFFATINLPDSAEFWYLQIVQDDPKGRFVPRALYTLAQIQAGRDSVASKPAVDSLYREILRRFPKSDFAPEARRLLGLPPEVPAVDDAEKAYTRAEKLMVGGDSTAAVEDFKKLAREYPSSPLASRALYAAGWIYENRLFESDSAIAAYTRLMALYPASLYAARVSPKIGEVNQKKKDAAAADSLEARKLRLPPVRTAADSVRARAVSDSISVREEVFRPKPVPSIPDSAEVKKIPKVSPRMGPGKEGIPP